MRKALVLLLFFAGVISVTGNAQPITVPPLEKWPAHPRILLVKGEEQAIERSVADNPVWRKMHEAILRASDTIIGLPTLERKLIGRRLLSKGRECVRRLFYLSYAYRMTGAEKYLLRAEKEMLAVSQFSDWNPSHFLDVAEMTMGMSIGYDWLFDKLSPGAKKIIREAILQKGLEPSFDSRYNWFLTATHNWNQVCNAGMTYGALAVAEDHPDTSKLIIERALNTISLPMGDYKPDGAYPEGYSYWNYGTSFNVMFLSAIEKAFGSDFGLLQSPGFLKTGSFLENMTGPTGASYNWGDCGTGTNLSPAMFWFAQRNQDPSLLWVEKKFLDRSDYRSLAWERLLPGAIIWGKDIPLNKINAPASNVWVGQGPSPVALMRTSWTDPNAIYLGFKAGSPSVNHAHMDIGSFIMEWGGVRWASDLGSQEYESLESKGIQVFGRTQDAQRWSIFRMNNFAHNTLTVDGKLQLVKGYAKIDRYSDNPRFRYAISDLSTVYEDQLKRITRGVGIVDDGYVVIRDELTTLDKPTTIRWTMLTAADVEIVNKNTVFLKKDGKQLTLHVDSRAKVELKTWSSQPTTTYDAPNPGTTFVGFEVTVPANHAETFTVRLIPEVKKIKTKIRSLDRWK
ncbi:heparinase II/III family protein [Fulvivirgaceae bacterium PWU4]|uniref:Heparinase II/III family protein n=1 Tax=Chryseosolibacter histidini TaxID=2782349 RepID=A0AAP2GGU8_9BACT|nr:heparinase II/III family protein [Chryseosolibacter histidini]MBT1695301.1 heparinase II/III family protein [Chryseosolibacter histidini]